MARKGRRSSNEERVNAIRLLEQGYTKEEVARIFNVTESSVYGWQKAYRKDGLAALSTKIASERKRLLSDKQLLQLSGWIRRDPRQLELDFGLWTRKLARVSNDHAPCHGVLPAGKGFSGSLAPMT